ncbi:MAG: hypothetical protein NE327_13805 [Lentisphaeraceae bacterium]|nr:hypothetical protein [Lentisphaeraceae bacterium]
MAYSYEIFPSKQLVEIKIFGIDTEADVLERITKITSDEKWQPGFGVLMDMQEVEELRISFDESWNIKEVHRLMEKMIGNCKMALVTQNPHVFGVARMWESLAEELNFEFRIFEEISAGRGWIQTTLAELPPPLN